LTRTSRRPGLNVVFACLALLASLAAFAPAAGAEGVLAWGGNQWGQLGNGTRSANDPPQLVSGLTEPVAVAAGHRFSVALLSNGTVATWGFGEAGALGDGAENSASVPVQVAGLSEVTQVSAGSNFALALRRNGTVMAWGENQFGQLGNGTSTDSSVPVEVKGLTEVTAISAGRRFSVALLRDGTVRMWGYNGPVNEGGELGIGTYIGPEQCYFANHVTTYCSRTPVKVIELSGVTAISAGCTHTLALLADGEVEAWGGNSYGELGVGNKGTGTHRKRSYRPVHVLNVTEAVAVSAGNKYSLVLLRNGTAVAFGKNVIGELGDGTHKLKRRPSPVAGLKNAVAISASPGEAGEDHSLALLSDGTVMGWGDNSNRQLGAGIPTTIAVPVKLPGLSHITAISADGTSHSLALTTG
jgi:alpha-tubulin suppressor-like RCC1 family protein